MIKKNSSLNKKILFLTLIFLFFVFGIWRFSLEIRRVKNQKITAWIENQSSDCAVVLTGGKGRVSEGFDLLSQRRVKKLIISGVYPGANLREIFPQWIFYGNLSEKDVVLEKRSRTTYGNALQSQAIVDALFCKNIILITSRIHMYRAYKIFRSIFPSDFPIYPRSILTEDYDIHFLKLSIEVIKSLFYSLWAY